MQDLLGHIASDAGVSTSFAWERADSDCDEVWIGSQFVIRVRRSGSPDRLAHEAAVGARLPGAALHPNVVASGRTDGHDWLVLERAPGERLSVVWPVLTDEERRAAIHQFARALKAVHGVDPAGLEPPCMFGDTRFVARASMADETKRLLADADLEVGLADRLGERVAEWTVFVSDSADALVHGDLNFNNVLWDDGRVTALLDFEWARPDARDVDLFSFLAFCNDAEQCVPEHVQAITKKEQYVEAPEWLREEYPELFSNPHVTERVAFYGIARWAPWLHLPEQSHRRLAREKLLEILENRGPADLLVDR